MIKADKTVCRETKYIAFVVIILSVLMEAIFLILQKWDYTVLLGNLLSGAIAVLNFFFMGITIQKSLKKEPADAKKLMHASQSARNLGMFVVVAIGVLLPYFNTVAVIAPMFFPRIAIALRPLRKEKEVIEK